MELKIYTRTGDKGETSLFGGKRVSKASVRVEAYGTVDELNSVIGVAITEVSSRKYKISIRKELFQIQKDLFEIGSALASLKKMNQESGIRNAGQRVQELEKMIDDLTKKLPVLRNFILPGGGKSGALLHQARTICRRGERRIVELSHKEFVPSEIIMYMNRLSDLLFTMARFVNHTQKKKETIWKIEQKSNT